MNKKLSDSSDEKSKKLTADMNKKLQEVNNHIDKLNIDINDNTKLIEENHDELNNEINNNTKLINNNIDDINKLNIDVYDKVQKLCTEN